MFHHHDEATRRYDVAAAALCLAELVLALVAGHFHRVGGFRVETDFYGIYAVQAENLLAGRPYTYLNHPPGYPALLAAASLLGADTFTASKTISAAATALFAWVSYLLMKALFNPWVAFGTTLLLLPATFRFSFLAASDIVGAAMIATALWMALRVPRFSPIPCLLAGAFAGAAYLLRYNLVFVAIAMAIAIVVVGVDRERVRGRLAQAGLFACAALVVASPWLIRNWRITGSPLGGVAYLQVATHMHMPRLNPQLSAALRERVVAPSAAVSRLKVARRFRSFTDVIAYDPRGFLQKFLNNLYRHAGLLAAEGLQFPAYLIAPIGLILLAGDLSRRRLIYLVSCLFGYLPLCLVGFHLRYYLFLFPLGFLSAAYLLFRTVPERISLVGVRVPLRWLALLSVASFLAVNAYRETSNAFATEPRHLIQLADFLRGRSTPGEVIIARKPHLAYLAGLRDTFPFVESAEAYLTEAHKRGARYVVYSADEAEEWPGLQSLWDARAVPPGLRLIYYHPPTQTLIYEVDSAQPALTPQPGGGTPEEAQRRGLNY